jgi:hypothetical protein
VTHQMQRVRMTTAHFVGMDAATKYYAIYGEDAADVLKEGRIFIGEPDYNPSTQKLSINNDGQYVIEER